MSEPQPETGKPIAEALAYFRAIDQALTMLEERFDAAAAASVDSMRSEVNRLHRSIRENLDALAAASSQVEQ